MSGAAIRSQAPFNLQRKFTTGNDSPTVKRIHTKKSSNRLKKDTAQSGSIRPTTKVLSGQGPNHSLVMVDTLQVRMPAPSDTSVLVSPLSSSIDNISNNDQLEDSSNFSLNTSLGRDMTDIMVEDGFSSDVTASDNTGENSRSIERSQFIQSPSIIEADTLNSDSAILRESPTPLDDNEKYTHDLTQFINDHETRNWTPRSKERHINIHAENITDPPITSQNVNDIEQRQVRQFVEKLKRAVSNHSLSENNQHPMTNVDSQGKRRHNSDLELHVSKLRSIWDEPKPFLPDLSDNESDEQSLDIPSLPSFRRPHLDNRQSSDADINATWVKDQDNAPIGWLSRHGKGNFANTGFACPVPAKFLPRCKEYTDEKVLNVAIGTVEEAMCEPAVTANPLDAIPNIPSSIATDIIDSSLKDSSSFNNIQVVEPVLVNDIPDADAISIVPSPSLSSDERSDITDSSSVNDAYNHSSVHSSSGLLENIPHDELMLAHNVKDNIIDTNLEPTPENMLQKQQARPHTHVFQKHTYSFSHDLSITTSGSKNDASMAQEQLTQTNSVAVSFQQPYAPIDIDPISHAFQRMVEGHDQNCHDDRRSQSAQVAVRGEVNDAMLIRKEDELDASLTTIIERLACLRPFEEWNQIRYLDLSHQNLSAISGLRDCVPLLEVLNISHNAITHIGKLPRSLRHLKAQHNKLTECSGLSDLHNLSYLNISQNMLESLQELSTLRSLQEMHAEKNLISTWGGVKQLKSLERLNLSHNRLRDLDLSQSSLHSLEMLNLAFNRIERLENLEHLPSLRAMNLDHNEIKWINIYQPLPSLELLRLSFNRLKIMDASPFPSVKTLYLDDNQLITVKNLSALDHLDSFSMRDQGGHKIDIDINDLRRVRKLFLSGNALPDLQAFQGFTNLEYLELCSTQLETLPNDFSFHFPNLVILYLSGNYLIDIAPLADCSQLQKLVLVNNRLDNLKSLTQTLKHLHSLLILDLRHNSLNSKFYATLSNPTGPSEELISHYLSYEHDLRWNDNDHVFNRCMPQVWRGKREEYRASILKACKKIKLLDGIKFEKIDCIQAQQLLRRKIKDRT